MTRWLLLVLLSLPSGLWPASPNVTDATVVAHAAAVVSAGSTISASTLAVETRFVTRLKINGVWSKLDRVSLMDGADLTAAMVPLLPGHGSATETNTGPFVNGDYTETGTSGGLNNGSSTTKYLDTGLTPDTGYGASSTNFSMGCFLMDDTYGSGATSSPFMGSSTANTNTETWLAAGGALGFNNFTTTTYAGPGLKLLSCTTSGLYTVDGWCNNRVPHVPTTAAFASQTIFGAKKSSAFRVGNGRVGGYFYGAALTVADQQEMVLAFDEAMRGLTRLASTPYALFIGDSITRGYLMTTAGQRWSRQVALAMGCREVNLGVDYTRMRADYTPTNPYAYGLINRYTDGITLMPSRLPCAVCILIGTNDAYDDAGVGGTPATAADYETKLETVIAYYKAAGVPAAHIVVGSLPYGTDTPLADAAKMALYQSKAALAASNQSVKYADVYATTSTSASYTLQGDGIHPTSGGQTVIGQVFIAAQP